jgi:hypothetical protein
MKGVIFCDCHKGAHGGAFDRKCAGKFDSLWEHCGFSVQSLQVSELQYMKIK